MTVRVIQRPEEFREVRPQWEELVRTAGFVSIFSTFDWLWLWWTHLGTGRLHVITFEEGGRLAAAAPLMVYARPGVRMLRSLGRPGSDYCGFIASNRPALDRLASHAMRPDGWDVADLEGLRDDDPTLRALGGTDLAGRLSGMSPLYGAPYLRLGASFEAYRETVRAKLLQDTERQWRRLRELGEARIEAYTDIAQAQALLPVLVRHKRARSDALGDPDLFADPRRQAFYAAVIEHFVERGWLKCSALWLGDTPIAVHLGFAHKGAYCWYLPSFDAAYARFSPGRLLLFGAIERAHREGFQEFDLMAGDEAYKDEWATHRRVVYRHYSYPRSAWGRLLYGAREVAVPRLRPTVRRVIRVVRGVARRR